MAARPSYQARGHQRIVMLPVAASQTIKKGDIILFATTTGKVQQGVAAGSPLPVATSGANTGRVVGRAEADITTGATVTTEEIPVMIAEPGTQFLLPVYHATAASAVPNLADIGKAFEIFRVDASPDYYAVDIGETTDKKCKIVEINRSDFTAYPNAASGDQYGTVWVEFLINQCALSGGDYTATVD